MSNPLASVFRGDVTLEVGQDVLEFGHGDLKINRSILLNSGFSTGSASISLNATTDSNVTTNSGTLTLASTDTAATGIIHMTSSGTAVNAIDIDTATGGISMDAVKSSNLTITSAAPATLTLSTSGDAGNKILMNTVTSTATDAITVDSSLGGVRINSSGAAGSGTGIVLTSIDNSSFTTTNGKLQMNVNSSTVTDNLELYNTLGTNDGTSGSGAIDINAVAGGFSINAVKSSNIEMASASAQTLTMLTSGNVGNKILVRAVTSTSGDAIKLQSSAGGIKLDSDGAAGSGTGIVLQSIDDSSWTTTEGEILIHVNSSVVTDNLDIKNTAGTNDGTTGNGAIDIDAIAGGFSIDAVKSSNIQLTSSAPATLKLATTGDVGNKIILNTTTSTASDSITIDSDLGGIRLISDGAAGGSNGIVMTAIDDSSWTTSNGKLQLNVNSSTVTDNLELYNTLGTNSGSTGAGAVDINAVAGGVSIDGIKSSRFKLTSTAAADLEFLTSGHVGNQISINTATSTLTNAISVVSTAGGIEIDAGGAAGSGGGVAISAVDDSSFVTSDGGINVQVNSSTVTDNLTLQNTNGTNVNAVDILASAGGVSIDAVKDSNFTVTGADLTVEVSGSTTGNLNLLATGSTEPTAVNIDSGIGGVAIDAGLAIVMTAVGDSSLTTTDGEITLQVNSATVGDSLNLINTNGTATDAVNLTAGAGGILIDASGGAGNSPISIQTNDTTNGIDIATGTPGVPVTIGTASSTTTVVGDFVVSGTTTTVNTATLTIEDNIILVNSGPSGTADGGLAVQRYQEWNDAATGDVVADPAMQTSADHAIDGFIVAATATTVTFDNDGPSPPSSVDNFYNDWWIKITAGTGVSQVRRIKSYVGATRVATLYSTADETATPTTPPTGRDWTVIPSATDSEYTLHACSYAVTFYDESADEWVFACSTSDPATGGEISINEYLDIHAGDAIFEGDVTINGAINGLQLDTTEVVTLVDNNNTGVVIVGSEDYGAYFISVKEVATNSLTGVTVETGAFATFTASGRSGKAGNVNRLSSAKGADNEQLDMEWNNGEKLKLKYRPNPSGAGANRYYIVKLNRLN